jgi:hypothetical protein
LQARWQIPVLQVGWQVSLSAEVSIVSVVGLAFRQSYGLSPARVVTPFTRSVVFGVSCRWLPAILQAYYFFSHVSDFCQQETIFFFIPSTTVNVG